MVLIILYVIALSASLYSYYFGATFVSELGGEPFLTSLIELLTTVSGGYSVAQLSAIVVSIIGIASVATKRSSKITSAIIGLGTIVAIFGGAFTVWTKMQDSGVFILGFTGPIYIEPIIIVSLILAFVLNMSLIRRDNS